MSTKYNKNLAQISELLVAQRLTLAVAESCTSGLIQNAFSQAPDAMMFYQGGVTVYNAGQKAKQLNINPIFADACNSVSKEIAVKMAVEIAEKFNSEIGIAITGYAQPVPDDGVPNCFAYIAISRNSKLICAKRIRGEAAKSLHENQEIYTGKILKELLTILK